MKKYLHMAGEAAGKLLAAAAKLAKRLAYTVMRTVGAAAGVVGKALKSLLDKAACGVGKKARRVVPPLCKIVMIASGAVAVLSCVGWLISRKKCA